MAGLKIRVPESPVWVEMVRGFGAAPTPIPFGEVYTALQQKTVDGQENPIPTIFSRKFYEVQGVPDDDAGTCCRTTRSLINKASFDKLSPAAAEAAARRGGGRLREEHRSCSRAREASMLEDIRKSGKTKVIDNPDRAAFAAKMAAVYPKLEARWGVDHWKQMRSEIDKVRGK